MKTAPKYTFLLVGLVVFAAGIGVSVFAPHAPVDDIPPVAFHILANGLRGLGIGFGIGAFLRRRPAKVVEGH